MGLISKLDFGINAHMMDLKETKIIDMKI